MDYLTTARHDAHHPLDVMVVGEALIDVVTTSHDTVEHPGGSPANVAYGLGRLGVTTGLLTAIAPDARGISIENHLRSAGVILLPGSKSLTRTASATATLAPDGSARYDFDISWDLAPTAPAYFPKILHTGSIATFLSPGAGAVKSLLEQAHRHCMITYDPNIRPALLGSHAEAKATFEELVALNRRRQTQRRGRPMAVPPKKPGRNRSTHPRTGHPVDRHHQRREGSQFTSPAANIRIPAVKTTVADTIGAGDSYMSALILGFLTRGTEGFAPAVLEQLGHTAAAAAAITVQRPGSNPPTLEELNMAVGEPSRSPVRRVLKHTINGWLR